MLQLNVMYLVSLIKNKGDVRSRKSRVIKPVERYVEYDVSSSSDDDSDAVKSDKVLKRVKPAVKKNENLCGDKSKSVHGSKKLNNVESVLFSFSNNDSVESVATKLLSSSKARATGKKSGSRGVSSKPRSKMNTDVNEKSKVNHSKLSHVSRRQHHRGKSVKVCSENKSNTDKRSTFTRRRTFIRPDRFDGVTPTFASFKAHFENAAQFNRWREREQLAHLKASLVGAATQCL